MYYLRGGWFIWEVVIPKWCLPVWTEHCISYNYSYGTCIFCHCQFVRFTPTQLMERLHTKGYELGLVIDLTNTFRYYNGEVWKLWIYSNLMGNNDIPIENNDSLIGNNDRYLKLKIIKWHVVYDCSIFSYRRPLRQLVCHITR